MIQSVNYLESKPTFSRGTERALNQKQTAGKGISSAIKVDVQALFIPAPTGKISLAEETFVEGLFEKADHLLETLQCFLFDEKQKTFRRLPEWSIDHGREKCHLWSDECYVFLCIYKRETVEEVADQSEVGSVTQRISRKIGQNEVTKVSLLSPSNTSAGNLLKQSRDNLQHVPETDPSSFRECITYLWSGRDSPKPSFGELVFQHHFKRQIEALIQDASDGKMQLKSVTLQQERENIALLSHFQRECILHRGKRPSSFPEPYCQEPGSTPGSPVATRTSIDLKQIHLYHIRTEGKYRTTRAVEVSPMITSLISRDAFLLTGAGYNGLRAPSPENTFLWIGAGASRDETKRAQSIARRMLQFSLQGNTRSKDDLFTMVQQGKEIPNFWRLLAPSFSPPDVRSLETLIAKGQGFHFLTPPPRLFRCSTDTGYFLVHDCGIQFSVSDLRSNAVCFLDSGPGLGKSYPIWVWIGKDVSDVATKMTKKAIDTYLDHLNDGRSLEGSEWDPNHVSHEKSELVGRSLEQLKGGNASNSQIFWKNGASSTRPQSPTVNSLLSSNNSEVPKKNSQVPSNNNSQARLNEGTPPSERRRRVRKVDQPPSPNLFLCQQGAEPMGFKSFFLGWGDRLCVDADARVKHGIVEVDVGGESKHKRKEEPSNAFLREQRELKQQQAASSLKARLTDK